MFVNKNMDRNDVLTDPARLVRLELENAGYDMDGIHIPKRVFLLADSLYDTMLTRNCGEYRYPLGGKLFVFHGNEETVSRRAKMTFLSCKNKKSEKKRKKAEKSEK